MSRSIEERGTIAANARYLAGTQKIATTKVTHLLGGVDFRSSERLLTARGSYILTTTLANTLKGKETQNDVRYLSRL